jgi:hypothetical protein
MGPHMNTSTVPIGVQSLYLAGLTIPVVIGVLCGLFAARQKSFDSVASVIVTVLASGLAPVIAVFGMFTFAVLADILDTPHAGSTYFAVLAHSARMALRLLLMIVLVDVPVSAAVCLITQLLCHRRTLTRRR